MKLKVKKVKGRITVLKVLPYKGSMVYLRMVGEDIFMYDLVFKNEIYSSYLIISPKKGYNKLNKNEINQAGALIFAGAVSTIDTLLKEKVDKKTEEVVNTFEANRKKIENIIN